jgi:streptogramin lyase
MRSRSLRLIACSLGACAGMLGFSAAAYALTPTINEYSSGLLTGASPRAIVAGPDGRLWFTDEGAPAIGRIDPATHSIDEFNSGLPSDAGPTEIAAGPDGALWFTDNGSTTKALGRATTAGAITEFTPPNTTPTAGVAAGSDGNIWFINEKSPESIARVTLPGEHLDTFSSGLGPSPTLEALAAGPDGNLWFTDEGTPQAIGRVVPATGAITEFPLPPGHDPQFIAAGPDGNLWATDFPEIERITPEGSITPFSAGLNAGSAPEGIAAGPDGAIWFTDRGTTKAIGRITTSGQITEFPLNAGADPFEIARGADGAMWFTDEGSTRGIGRITTPPAASTVSVTAGQTAATVVASANGNSEPATFHIEYGPPGAPTTSTPEQSVGPANTLETLVVQLNGLQPATTYQARIVATNPTGTAEGAFVTFTTAAATVPPPRLSRLRLSPRTFVAAKRGPTILAAARRKPGTIVSYRDSANATTSFTVFRIESGRRAGHRCVKPTRRNRHAKRCSRFVRFGRSFRHVDRLGVNRFRFSGRVSRRRLPAGSYRLAARAAVGAARGPLAQTRFRVRAR